jgi:hypothetical protein
MCILGISKAKRISYNPIVYGGKRKTHTCMEKVHFALSQSSNKNVNSSVLPLEKRKMSTIMCVQTERKIRDCTRSVVNASLSIQNIRFGQGTSWLAVGKRFA